MSKKTNKVYVWLAVDRVRNQVVDFEVSSNRDLSSYLQLALRLEERCEIKISCSDYYDVYGTYKIAKQHYFTKKETTLVVFT